MCVDVGGTFVAHVPRVDEALPRQWGAAHKSVTWGAAHIITATHNYTQLHTATHNPHQKNLGLLSTLSLLVLHTLLIHVVTLFYLRYVCFTRSAICIRAFMNHF